MRNEKLLFLGKLVAFSLVGFYIWEKYLTGFYGEILKGVVKPVTLFFSSGAQKIFLWEHFYYVFPPFVALALALRLALPAFGEALFSKSLRLTLGLAGLFLWHIVLLVLLNLVFNNLSTATIGKIQLAFFPYAFGSVLNMAVPVVIWIILFKKEVQVLLS